MKRPVVFDSHARGESAASIEMQYWMGELAGTRRLHLVESGGLRIRLRDRWPLWPLR